MGVGSPNTVTIVVESEDRTSPGVASADERVKALGAEASRAGEQLRGLGDESARAGDRAHYLAGESGKVNAEITRLRGDIKALNAELDRTGDTALFRQIDTKRVELRRFEQVAKDLARDAEDVRRNTSNNSGFGALMATLNMGSSAARGEVTRLRGEIRALTREMDRTGNFSLLGDIGRKGGELRTAERLAASLVAQTKEAVVQAGPQMVKTIEGGLDLTPSVIKPALIGALVALGIGIAPGLGAAIGGAVIGGVGLGGIVGGIVGAAHDPAVHTAAHSFAQSVSGDFQDLGTSYVGAVVGSLDTLRFGIKGLLSGDQLGPAIRDLSREVQPLAQGLVGLFREAVPGFVAGLKLAQPVLQAMAQALPGLGRDLGQMIKTISDDPQAAIMGMKVLFMLIGKTLIATGELVKFLEDAFRSLVKIETYSTDKLMGFERLATLFVPFIGILDKVFHVSSTDKDLHELQKALDDALHGTEDLSSGFQGLGTDAANAAAEMQKLATAIDDVFANQMSWDQANVHAQQGLIDLRKELADGAKTLFLYSQEGLKNREALLNQIEAYSQLRDAQYKQTGDLDAANDAYQRNLRSLYDMAIKAGFARQELDKLFGPYFSGVQTAKMNFEFPGLFEGLEGMKRAAEFASQASSWASFRATERHAAGGPSGGGWSMFNDNELVKLPTGAMVYPAGQSQQMMAQQASPTIIVQLLDPMTGAVIRQAAITDAKTRGVDDATVAAAYP